MGNLLYLSNYFFRGWTKKSPLVNSKLHPPNFLHSSNKEEKFFEICSVLSKLKSILWDLKIEGEVRILLKKDKTISKKKSLCIFFRKYNLLKINAFLFMYKGWLKAVRRFFIVEIQQLFRIIRITRTFYSRKEIKVLSKVYNFPSYS